MMLVSIAATSAVRYMDLRKNKPPRSRSDSTIFQECIERFFPWDHIGVTDREFIAMGCQRSPAELRKEAAKTLYTAIRNPLLHSGGAVSKTFPKVSIQHDFPGRSFQTTRTFATGATVQLSMGRKY
jgi:hypothetical protein